MNNVIEFLGENLGVVAIAWLVIVLSIIIFTHEATKDGKW